MNKQQISILERAYVAEVNGALSGSGLDILQTKSKVAAKLAEEGYLEKVEHIINEGVITIYIKGYRLTHLGRMTYCATCEGE